MVSDCWVDKTKLRMRVTQLEREALNHHEELEMRDRAILELSQALGLQFDEPESGMVGSQRASLNTRTPDFQ